MRLIFRLTVGLVLMLIIIVVNIEQVFPETQVAPNRDRPPLVDNFSELPIRFDLNEKEPAPLSVSDTDVILSWSQIAFSSYRDNNWEIIVANDDGSNERRLTHNAATDTLPQMDKGCKRIAFSSNRDGDDEIFTMNVDGSGLRQLTANTAHDFNPTWSPDGSKIAFQSYRNGQYEIYVMNADGSQQTRLTTNDAYDGMPDWSPNGQKIAFVSNRSSSWRIWVMNADGSNPLQLSSQALSQNPIWSPDGNYIAYDADGNNDSWQELWVMNADGTNQHLVHDPGYPYDAWASSWSPDGKYVAFTQARWQYYEGNWYWVAAELFRNGMPYGGAESVYIYTPYDSAYPNWQTKDTIPPRSEIEELPAYLRTSAEVTWFGTDQGGSGIRHYNVQYRSDTSSSWTNWNMESLAESGNWDLFGNQPGEKFHFRSQAVDRSFNEEALKTGEGDTSVTFYRWAISGMAYDNRHTPLSGVVTKDGYQAFEIWPSDANGNYRSYYADDSYTFTTAWGKNGYLDLPITSFNSSQDDKLNVVIPPIDNVIEDWGFESGVLPSASWSVGGLYSPTIVADAHHTGVNAVSVGKPYGFEPPTLLFNGSGLWFKPQIALDETGGIHAIWTDNTYYQMQILYAYRTPDGTWSPSQIITTEASSFQPIQWGISDTGHVHVIWQLATNSNLLYHSWRDESGVWSTPQLLSDQGGSKTPIRLAVDANGNAHFVWNLEGTSVDDFYYAHTDQNGTWSSPSRIGAMDEYTVIDMALGSNGKVHLLWRQNWNVIYYSYRLPDGTWSNLELVLTGEGTIWNHRFEAYEQSQVDILIEDFYADKIYHRRRYPDSSWSPVKTLTDLSELQDPVENGMQAKTAIDGSTHIFWTDTSNSYDCPDLAYAKIDSAGQWVSPVLLQFDNHCVDNLWLNVDDTDPFVIFSSNKAICAVRINATSQIKPRCAYPDLSDYDEPYIVLGDDELVYAIQIGRNAEVLFTEIIREKVASDSNIAQEVAVPDASNHPTLSFIYRLDDGAEDGAYLEASVTDSANTNTLFTATTTTADWTHQWLDLSPWGGQNITVTFQVHQVPGAFSTAAFLDEVTLGSAYPDTWVNLSLPSGVGAGWPVNMVINYGNRGGVAADGGQLILTLPDEISFVSAQPAPNTMTPVMSWELGQLTADSSGSIIVTGLMAPDATFNDLLTITAELSSATTELEMQNNEYEKIVRVGHHLLLPIIVKD